MATEEEPETGLGGRLKRLRKTRYDRDKKWTLEWVAGEVGTTKANLSKIESKPSTRIELSVFFALADLYEVDPRQLATGEQPESPAPNMIPFIECYLSIDTDVRAPIRALIEKLAELAHSKQAPRKERSKKTARA